MQSLNVVQMKMRITKKEEAEEETKVKEGEEGEPTYCVELIGQDVDKFRFDKAALDLTKTCLSFAIDEVELPVQWMLFQPVQVLQGLSKDVFSESLK